jgi:hypothetical protein
MAEKRIKSNAARLNYHDVLADAEKHGICTGISRWDDPPAGWVVSDEWFQRAEACLPVPDGLRRRRAATQALRHFRDVLDGAENHGIFTGICHWKHPPSVWVVPGKWYQQAKACLDSLPAPVGGHPSEETQ